MSENVETVNEIRANWAPTELDTQVEALIKETEHEVAVAGLPPEEPTQGESEKDATTETASVEGDGDDAAKAAPSSPELERLVTREVDLKAKETKYAEWEAREAAYQTKIRELEGLIPRNDPNLEIGVDPVATLEAMGHDPDDIVRKIIAQRMGKDAPEALRAELKSTATEKRIRELELRLIERERQAAGQAFVAQIESGARKYVTDGVSEKTPTISRMAKANPERAYREIMEEISKDANIRASRDPNGDVLTYEEAASRAEARLSELVGIFAPVASTTQPSVNEVKKEPPVTNSVKPPDKPLAPWLQRSDVSEDGIKAGLQEYRRAVSPQKTK